MENPNFYLNRHYSNDPSEYINTKQGVFFDQLNLNMLQGMLFKRKGMRVFARDDLSEIN